ncbi:hypothetical protein RvY_04671 [Ramazzottius varieornatus]|uniref:Tight junction protein ZO-1 n=1 Tax=Ramazzottius varieornatus TaxID=947166 RepID=A0A1D1UVW5_RAMVA|nr:hypothetical protein RvY_04671 [Ramazzottius varieornatus]
MIMDSMNGALSDSAVLPDNLGALQNVDLPLLLTALLHNGTLTPAEQQVVQHEGTKPRQCHALLQIICSKGLTAMESFLKYTAMHQLQQYPFPNGYKQDGFMTNGYPAFEKPADGVQTVTGKNEQDQASKSTPHFSSTSQSATDSINPERRSQLGNFSNSNAAEGGFATSSSLQDEIAKAMEDKFGPNMSVRIPPNYVSSDQLDGATFEHKALPSIPEFGLANGYPMPMKSPKLPNRNVDLSSLPPNSMVSQLLQAHCSNQQSTSKMNNGSQAQEGIDGGSVGGGGLANEEPDTLYEFHEVSLTKLPPYGFGIAVSGGRDNPHFANGDPSIAVSDVLKTGPAEGRLFINDRIITVNGTNLENVDYSYAITVLKDSPTVVNLLIKRKAAAAGPPLTPGTTRYAATTYTVNLPKPTGTSKKKEEVFGGLVLGCILYVKDITNRTLVDAHGIQIGDTVLRIGNTPVDHLPFNEVKKVLEKRPKDRLQMVFQRPRGTRSAVVPSSHPNTPSVNQHRRQSSQNVYTELPTKTDNHVRQKSVDSMEGRLVNPNRERGGNHAVRSASMNLNLTKPTVDVSSPLAQRISVPLLSLSQRSPADTSALYMQSPRVEASLLNETPQANSPPSSFRRQEADGASAQDAISMSSDWRFPDPRFVTFRKDGSVGLRLTGGNEAGIFIMSAQANSPAALAGLMPGDKILKVNDKDMKGVTREEAVLFLLNLTEQIEMVVQHRKQEYDYIISSQIGDSFYIKTHFNYDPENKTDISFQTGDTFRVLDTLHTGSVGSWFVVKIGPNKVESVRGNIPSASRAEGLAKTLKNGSKGSKLYSNTLADRIRRRSRRAKSLTKDQWDEVAYAAVETKFPAYERIILKMPHFQRPVVFFGPLADIAREKLIKEQPEKFASPQMDVSGGSEEKSGIVRLSAIRQFMSQNKHCVLDVTCPAVDRLNYAQMYPIVIYTKAESKDVVKEIRMVAESKRKSTKKLIIEAQKLEKSSAFLFTGVVPIKSKTTWFKSICELIEQQQQSPIWMSEKQPETALADDFLFPMASSSSYSCASSGPESDAENMYDRPPVPPPRRLSKDELMVNGVQNAVRSPPAALSQINGPPRSARELRPTEAIYKHSPSLSTSSSSEYKENRGPSQTYQAFPFNPNQGEQFDPSHINLFATLRTHRHAGPPSLPRRPRPPPITVPSSSEERFAGKPTNSRSFADLPTVSNGKPSTSGTYEDPKAYDPYRISSSRSSVEHTMTLDRSRHREPRRSPQEGSPNMTSPSKLSLVPHQHTSPHSSSSNGYPSPNDIYGTRHPSIKEEPLAPPLPPKPKYLTNGRLKMFQQNGQSHVENGGFNPHATYSEPSPTKGAMRPNCTDSNGALFRPTRKNSMRPYLEPIDTSGNGNTAHKLNGHRTSYHDAFAFADDDRSSASPSQMNFPPPPDDFLNSPKKLNAPEVIAEVRGFFDHHGGVLLSEDTGVSLTIPPGALPVGLRQEVYFKVCREDNILSTLDREKGERLLSPCVLCGPSGLTFLKPLELKLPHSANSSPSTGSFSSGKSPRLPNGSLNGNHDDIYQNKFSQSPKVPNGNSVSVYVDHF